MSRLLQMLVMIGAAILEVGGDALIRAGLRGRGVALVVLGGAALSAYGIGVNLLPGDFARLFGAYVAFFAVASVAMGRFAFHETIATSTWIGLAIVLAGSAVIQYGRR